MKKFFRTKSTQVKQGNGEKAYAKSSPVKRKNYLVTIDELIPQEVLPAPSPFKNQPTLPRHPCTRCDKRYNHLWDLDKHLMRDHGIEHYNACDQCDRVFLDMKNLEMHRKTHGERRFACWMCTMAFFKEKYLKLHLTNFHEQPEHLVEELFEGAITDYQGPNRHSWMASELGNITAITETFDASYSPSLTSSSNESIVNNDDMELEVFVGRLELND